MFKILIVDDSDVKVNNIKEVLVDIPAIQIDVVDNLISATDILTHTQFDVTIIDINLPTRHGSEPKPYNGITLIDQIKLSTTLHKPIYIIGLSEYPDLVEKYSSKFQDDMVYLLNYVDNEDGWRRKIKGHVTYANDLKNSSRKIPNYNYDLAVITALHDPELSYLLKIPANWQKLKIAGDSTMYFEGFFSSGDKNLKVVAAAAPQMGMPASTALSMKIIEHFRPRYLAMVGIAAGVEGKCKLGDIIIADVSWDYGSGKIKRKGASISFEPDPKPLPLSFDLKEQLQNIVREQKYMDEIGAEWKGSENNPSSSVHIGPIASGAAVLEDPVLIREIATHNRKLIGIEMEIYGLFYAAANCTEPRPQSFAIKGVCDFGNSNKNDDYQNYASYASSSFLHKFVMEEL